MESLRRFAGFPDVTAALPDETTILNFRHLLERHRQLVGCGQQVDWASGMAIYIIAAMLLISAQIWNVRVLEALCSAAVR
jgi:hypothetical protein